MWLDGRKEINLLLSQKYGVKYPGNTQPDTIFECRSKLPLFVAVAKSEMKPKREINRET